MSLTIKLMIPSINNPSELRCLDVYGSKSAALKAARQFAMTYKETVVLDNTYYGTKTEVTPDGKSRSIK